MSIQINHAEAEKKLLAAFKAPCKKSDGILASISAIISGTHKTYKYILLTGLLAKATDEKADPLALQSGAPLKGAYDARSLCHGVIVPFERNFLQNSLGGSNEPFLNKPARFTHLSNKNAVRKGSDKETLNKLIDIFQKITTSEEAMQYLACSLKILINRIKELSKLHKTAVSFNPTLIDIYEFISKFTEKSFEGETCAIVVGTLEKIYYMSLKGNFRVVPHKVNQSGSSSKEIGDVDIFEKDSFCYSIEVKDKAFTEHDIEHAFNKIIENGGSKGAFIYGPRASFDEASIKTKLGDYERKGFSTWFVGIPVYSKMMLFRSNIRDRTIFINALMETAIQINSKETVKKWIQELLEKLKWNRGYMP